MDLNRVLVAGRLTADPELKNLPSGDPVCNFTLAINRRWRDPQTGEDREDAVFLDSKCYGKRAPVMHEHFRKGKNVLLEGSLRQERWEKEGQKHSKIVLVVERFEFIDRAPQTVGAGPREAHPGSDSPAEHDSSAPSASPLVSPVAPAEPLRAGSIVARRRREKALAAAGNAVDPAQVPF